MFTTRMATERTSPKPFTDLEREIVKQVAALRTMAGLEQDQMGLPRNTYGSIERLDRHATMGQLDAIVSAIVRTGETDLTDVADLIARAERVLRIKRGSLG